MYSGFFLLTLLLSSCNAFSRFSSDSSLQVRQDATGGQDPSDSNTSDVQAAQAVLNDTTSLNDTQLACEDILESGINATCWNVLNMTEWMNNWNLTNEATCQTNELWANCFLRVGGFNVGEGLGCAQIGPNTCPEPTPDALVLADTETAYGATNIWALQNLYTAIYNDLQGDAGLDLIRSAWNNLTTAQQGNQDGKSLLAAILFSTSDPRTTFMGLQVTTSIPMPFARDISIPNVGAAQAVLEDVLATYLLSAMTNYTLGGFWGMAKDGKLMD